jgi:hypothetical protein
LASPFFGLTSDEAGSAARRRDIQEKSLEETFLLMYYCGFSYSDARGLTLRHREWFVQRVIKEMTKSSEKKDSSSQSRAAHQNSPDVRNLLGLDRDHVPANLRRFT